MLSSGAVSGSATAWEIESKADSFSVLRDVGNNPYVSAFLKVEWATGTDAFGGSGTREGVVEGRAAYVTKVRWVFLLVFFRFVPLKGLAGAGFLS